ncbi:amino acid permease [Segetibacter sp.]|jgi:APA family basic amino acid/polyamine antiporter|uniref:amino acid permease n=1 Tax=Segetibacter sp. TaxID=2231182 RepID=UPI00260D6115|nr:amino acid permease [Segetibacter sp.]MCW3080182.1 amino acid transporter [Segetibacter sp.]
MANPLLRKKSIDKILADAEAGLHDGHGTLNKVLGVKDLTLMGIAAVIGAGIFSSIGKACFDGGPGVIFLYIFTAIACGFAALCYAEFASTVPVAGSAYTYSYVAFGEIFAWIIGWDLLMEYAIGNIAVAISWSDYFTGLLDKAGIHIPAWLTMDYTTAHVGFDQVNGMLAAGQALTSVDPGIVNRYNAWFHAPQLLGMHVIMDLPALMIVALITYIVFIGIQESKSASNIMVIIKLAVIFLVIVLGAYYVQPQNWTPFTPNGISGVLKGVSAVFFAYIGFDAISTTAEECKNPQRDLPRGMIYSLIICTVLYVLLALVLTGMVHYTTLNVGDPLAMIFEARGLKWISGIVGVSAIIATASVLLIFQLGQPRIWMSMSRDGLLPKIFSRLHPVYKTPSFSTILTGCLVAIPALFLNLDVVLALTSIGTLFAFVLVCAGVLVLQKRKTQAVSKFKVPFVNGKYIVPTVFIIAVVLVALYAPAHFVNILSKEGFPMLLFWIVASAVSIFSFKNSFSLIPVLGLISCFYLMAQESHTNWLRFLIWLAVGLIVYFGYGIRKSKLALNTV